LIDHGYAPLSRFGQYTLDVQDADGKRVYFGMFETSTERAMMGRKMAAQFPGSSVSTGTMSAEAYKMFAGVSPETAELFGEMLGLDTEADSESGKAFQEYLKLSKSSRSAMKRLIHRKGIAGFSEDAGRVLAGFIYSNARQTSSNLNMKAIDDAVVSIDKADGQLADAAVKLRDYIKNPVEEAQAFRGLLFAQYLGGSVASAMVNALQPVGVTFPYLSQFGGIRKAGVRMVDASRDALKKQTGDAALDAAILKAEEEGIISPQEVHSLQAQAMGKSQLQSGDGTRGGDLLANANNLKSKVSLAWGKVFGIAEQLNRRITFIAAYRTAVEEGIANPAEFAEKAVAETQFTYNKGNKPRWARGAVGSTLFTFKQYSVNYLELLHRMATAGEPGSAQRKSGQKAALLALAVLFLMGGSDGLPFIKDAEDLVDGALQRMGYNFTSRGKMREFLAAQLGDGGADFVMRGISGIPGAPIDVSGRLGMGNVIPGTGLFVKKMDHTSDLAEFAGAAGDFAKRVFQAADQLVSGNASEAAKTISPVAARNLIKGVDMAESGMYKDTKGRKVVDTNPVEAILKGIGFQPNSAARISEASGQIQQLKGGYMLASSEIRADWAKAIFEGDKDGIAAAKQAIADWNEKNPDQNMSANMPAILRRVREMRKTKAQRVADTTPKSMRARASEELKAASS